MKSNTKDIKSIINKLTKNPKINKRFLELDALEIWSDIIGNNIQKYIKDASIYNYSLVIKVVSSTLKNELHYKKEKIIKKINNELGIELIKKMIIK